MSILHFIIGAATGVISGFGIGGGSILVLYLTAIAGVAQQDAGGINLLYFIGCAPAALIGHIRNHRIHWQAVVWCVPAGIVAAILVAWLIKDTNTGLMRRLFGLMLLYVGYKELSYAKKQKTTD